MIHNPVVQRILYSPLYGSHLLSIDLGAFLQQQSLATRSSVQFWFEEDRNLQVERTPAHQKMFDQHDLGHPTVELMNLDQFDHIQKIHRILKYHKRS